jgi:hypothetical protein
MQNAKEVVHDEKRAEALGNLQQLFEKQYDLTTNSGRQALVEGLVEIGKFAGATCSQATLSLTLGANGLTGVTVNTTPTPA